MIRDLVYGRNAVREALRGRRSVLEVWVGERAAATLEWLSEGPKPRVRRERELTEAAGSPDHQGICAEVGPYPYVDADSLLESPDALVHAATAIAMHQLDHVDLSDVDAMLQRFSAFARFIIVNVGAFADVCVAGLRRNVDGTIDCA